MDKDKEMREPNFEHVMEKATEAYDILSKLTFEFYKVDDKGLNFVCNAQNSIGELFRYARDKKVENETNVKD
jgi:hypothetical protein